MSGRDAEQVPVVGIGASAGGLEALNELVAAIPEQSGFCFVVIQHLSPDHPSMMDQLLSTHTNLPVHKIEDRSPIQADTIYVLPSGPSATVENGILRLHDRNPERGLRTPIDEFFVSLAENYGENAFGVILSGTGSDGTQGVRAIKAAGGIAIVQESESARFPGMPDSAAATGLVDFALKPKRIPERLIDIARHRRDVNGQAGGAEFRSDIEAALPDILAAIDDEDGHDFTQYKPGTLIRRIERRMTVVRERSVDSFISRLSRNAEERRTLLQDFLIGVTKFFRDEEAFVKLNQEVILPLLHRDQTSFRVWVPGCSTGEEAYSVAMLFSEAMTASGDNRQWQIFGTDIDSAALSHGRAAVYTDSQLDGVSTERREAFFHRAEGVYQVHPTLRERCIFAPHNLIQDPPFSRLDLICCRNLLIYLNAEIQETIIPRFHYGLNDGGYLFLGPSESLGKKDRFFRTIDRDARLFQRDDSEETAFSSLTTPREDAVRRERRVASSGPRSDGGQTMAPRPMEPSFEFQLLNFFARQSAPPFATVNRNDEVSYLSERMNRFVRPSQGPPSASLDQFLLRDLRLPVRSVIAEVRDTGDRAVSQNLIISREEGIQEVVDIEAVPLPFAEGSVLVTLQPVRTQDIADLAGSAEERNVAERDLIERELSITRRQLASTMTSFETTEQELKSSNEELLSMNEELQSSNEELETSREELQSINEELETVNAELSENNQQLTNANSDLKNLFDSTDIATVFLNQYLHVRRYTPASRRLFGIQDRDIGRPISDLKWNVSYESLEEDAARVADTLQPIEREVRIEATDETFLMRLRPYRRTDDRIDGCVLTFVDITERKRFERQIAENAEALSRQYSELETLYDTTPVGLSLLDRDLRYLRINETLARINGFPVEAHIGKTPGELFTETNSEIIEKLQSVLQTGEPVLNYSLTAETPGAGRRDYIVDYYPVMSEGEVFAVGAVVRDVTEAAEAAREIAQRTAELENLYNTVPVGLFLQDREGRFLRINESLAAQNGLSADEHVGKTPDEILGPLPEGLQEAFDSVVRTGEPVSDLAITVHLPEAENPVHLVYDFRPVRVEGDEVYAVAGVVRDVSEEYRLLQDLAESEARLTFALETNGIGAWDVDLASGEVERTRELDRIFGNEEPPEDWHAESATEYVLEEEQPRVREAYEKAIANSERLYLQYPIRRADGEIRWLEVHGRPVADAKGIASRFAGTIQDVTEQKEATERQLRLQAELAESEGRLRRLFDSSPVFIAITEGPDHVYTYSNPPHDAVTGHRELIGKPIIEALPELEGQGIVERFDEVYRTGETLRVPEFQATFDRNNDGELETGWFTQTLEPIRDGNGNTIGVATFAYEVTDVVEARERAEQSDAQKTLLLQELQHRVKNTMATTLAIVKFSSRGATDVEALKKTLSDRLQSIARTHDLLTANDWMGAQLQTVFRGEVEPYDDAGGDRVNFEGDDPTLSSKQVLSLTLAFHELATNAAKYGALSTDEGRVVLSSKLDAEGRLHLRWRELNGPPLDGSTNTPGFGTTLLEDIVGADLEGESFVERQADGLQWQISFPL